MHTHRIPSHRQLLLLALGVSLTTVVISGEILCRVWLALARHKAYYLTAPFFKRGQAPLVDYRLDVDDLHADAAPAGPKRHRRGERGPTWYFKLKPGAYPPPPPYTYPHYTINRLGFRGRDFDPQPPPGVHRVICIGESSTFGAESPDDQTWPARLEHHLNRAGRGAFEVINAGFVAYESQNYLNLVQQELLAYRPEFFIIYAGVNDLNVEPNFEVQPATALMREIHGRLYYGWSMLYTVVMERVYEAVKQSVVSSVVHRRHATEHFARNLNALMELAQARGVRCVVVRQMIYSPAALFTRDEVSVEEALAQQRTATPPPPGNGNYADPYTVVRLAELMQAARQVCQARHVPMVDVRPAMLAALQQAHEPYFLDYVHLTPTANDRFAQLLVPHILTASAASAGQ